MPGSKSQPMPTVDQLVTGSRAWIAGHDQKMPYDVKSLISGQPVAELWDETGDTLVHLFPQAAGKGPSFRVHSSIFASSITLTQLAHGNVHTQTDQQRDVSGQTRNFSQKTILSSASSSDKSPSIPPINRLTDTSDGGSSSSGSRGTRTTDDALDDTPRQINLYVPILSTGGALSSANKGEVQVTLEDTEALLAVRNMFAFLIGQSLIATERRPTIFAVFLKIGDSLKTYGFTNLDGSTFGEVAASSFDCYVDELKLADVRGSREKTIESIVLGERMRSVLLYNDAFVHAVGKYSDIQDVLQLPEPEAKFALIHSITRMRMERASIDLGIREKSINHRLAQLEFPSVFAGVLTSKQADERKQVRFGAWREHFLSTRRHVLGFLKAKYGAWPPKASSKKNNLETSGLNRLVLKELYRDFSDLYDLYVDRYSLTPRSNNDLLPDDNNDPNAPEEPVPRVLRRVFDEYDRSSPPVQPPVPFDTPLLPNLAATRLSFTGDARKDAKVRAKKLKDDEIPRLLDEASNPDTLNTRAKTSPFLQSMRARERKMAKGCNIIQLADQRAGTWIFLYAVLQALPMLVVDAPGVRFAQGVEYFLCEPPRSGVPWANAEAGRASRNWYGINGGAGVVSLPSDLVEHGVEGVYRRSHCWLRAKEWSHNLGPEQQQQQQQEAQASGGAPETPAYYPPPRSSSRPGSRNPSVAHSVRTSWEAQAPPSSLQGLPQTYSPALNGTSNGGYSPLMPPPSFAPPAMVLAPPGSPSRSRPSTPGRSTSYDRRTSVLALGLEALPLPQGVAPHGVMTSGHSAQSSLGGGITIPRSRPVTRDGGGLMTPAIARPITPGTSSGVSAGAGGKSFDDILSDMQADKGKGGKGKKDKKGN